MTEIGFHVSDAHRSFQYQAATNRAVVHCYNQHGTAEQWIKEGKEATYWTRLSCHRFRANVEQIVGRIERLVRHPK